MRKKELIKINKELERTNENLRYIINGYADDFMENKKHIEILQKIIKSLVEDNQSILNKLELSPKKDV